MNQKTKIFSAAAAAVLVSALIFASFAVAKSYAQIGNQTTTPPPAGNQTGPTIGNQTGAAAGNQTAGTTGNQTAGTTGNQTAGTTGNQTDLSQVHRLTGRISSVQLENGKPAWIQGGIWQLRVNVNGTGSSPAPAGNATAPTGNATSPASNVTAPTGNTTTPGGNMTGGNITTTAFEGSNVYQLPPSPGPAPAPGGNQTMPGGGAPPSPGPALTGNATGPATGNTTSPTGNATAPSGNATSATSGGGSTLTPGNTNLFFIAKFDMVKPDGTAAHEHNVTDLKASEVTFENNIFTVKGTATVTLKNGPVENVPVTIKILNGSVFTLTIDPAKTDNHFGSDPIYGTVEKGFK
jgi:hypothetical protein